MESRKIENYKTKEQQSQFYQEQEDECDLWLSQNLHGRKTSSIMTMLEQMVETRSWKVARGLIQDVHCRVCHERDETTELLLAGCKVLANNTYLSRHNRALMIMTVAWAKKYELVGGDMVWYKEGGNEEWCWKTKEEHSCGISNSVYAKPPRWEDLTWPSRTKQRKKNMDLQYGMPSITEHWG